MSKLVKHPLCKLWKLYCFHRSFKKCLKLAKKIAAEKITDHNEVDLIEKHLRISYIYSLEIQENQELTSLLNRFSKELNLILLQGSIGGECFIA